MDPRPAHEIRLLFQAWDEFDHALSGLSTEEAVTRRHGGSAIAWTAGHVANTTYALLYRPFAGGARNALIGGRRFATGGSGEASNWAQIIEAGEAIRRATRAYLETAPDLELTLPYRGSDAMLRQKGLSLRYSLTATAAHHLLHAGEVLTLRSLLGNSAPDYPGWGRDLI